jgi:hypothetical protein
MRFIFLIFGMALICCTPGQHEAKAHILERRVLPGNQLMIRYSFSVGTETVIDSVRTGNKVIPHDSVTVIYSASDPRKNSLKLQ